MRRRVAGDDPRTDQNNDGKGVNRAEVPPAKLSWMPGGCLSVGRPSVCLVPGIVLVCSPSRCWVLGGGLGCPGLFPRGWLLPLSSWFRFLCWPVVSLPVRGFFRYSHVFWRCWEVLWRFAPLPICFVRISLWVSSRRDEQGLGCKSRNFPAALTLGAYLPLCRSRERLRRTFCHASEFSCGRACA